MEKINPLFNALTARFGTYPLKDGQSIEAVKRSWERILGGYRKDDLVRICQHWCDTSKYGRWPEPGEILQMLKDGFCAPERSAQDPRPAFVKQAEVDADKFYRSLFTRRPPSPYVGLSYATALTEIVGVGKPQNEGRRFGELLTQAWLDNLIPNDFERKAHAVFDRLLEEREKFVHRRKVVDEAERRRRGKFLQAAAAFGYRGPRDRDEVEPISSSPTT